MSADSEVDRAFFRSLAAISKILVPLFRVWIKLSSSDWAIDKIRYEPETSSGYCGPIA